MSEWQLLSNHGRVLVFLAREPKSRLRDIAEGVDITERTAHRIVSELVEGGYLARKRNGSRNHYEIRPEVPINDPLLGDHWIGEILAVVAGTQAWSNDRATRPDGGPERRRADRGAGGRGSERRRSKAG
jgi:MarR family protein